MVWPTLYVPAGTSVWVIPAFPSSDRPIRLRGDHGSAVVRLVRGRIPVKVPASTIAGRVVTQHRDAGPKARRLRFEFSNGAKTVLRLEQKGGGIQPIQQVRV